MPLIVKQEFISLLESNIEDNNSDYYFGLGNPNSDVLLVGSEKALDMNNPDYNPIVQHELFLNTNHWIDTYRNYNENENPFDKILLNREGNLNGFNPFNPLFFDQTASIVGNKSGHTYSGIKRLINKLDGCMDVDLLDINFERNIFSKVFLTELSTKPALNQQIANFNLRSYFNCNRYHFLTNQAANFIRSFRIVILYCGKNNRYVGAINSIERLKIIQIFNPTLSHLDYTNINIGNTSLDIYENGNGSKVILCRHFSSGFSNQVAQVLANNF